MSCIAKVLDGLFVSCCVAMIGCGTSQVRGTDGEPPGARPPVQDAHAGQTARLQLSPAGVGSVATCSDLKNVNKAFSDADDTLFGSAGSDQAWPGKTVLLPDSGRLVFETSWPDSTRIATVRTTSALVTTPRGYSVGMHLRQLHQAGESLHVELPEGAVVVVITSEGIAATVDSSSQRAFYRVYDYRSQPSIRMLSPDARITSLSAGRDCGEVRSAP